jgi:signal transduction histidine kinase
VIVNLVSNALRFTPEGSVQVRVEAGANDVAVRVTDTGLGFAADQGERLFRQFSRLHPSVHGGTGLGLYIARAIVEMHGGSISARSDGPGKGATFEFRLPRLAPGPRPGKPVSMAMTPRVAGGGEASRVEPRRPPGLPPG